MIGSGLRKLATENGMQVAHGVAYGMLHGYCATLSEGFGYKLMVLSTRFADATARYSFQESMGQAQKELQKEYGVQAMTVEEKSISVVFTDTIGTMKRIEAFLQWFFPRLEQSGASKGNICSECGMQLTDGKWKLVDGVAIYVHEACGQKLRDELQLATEEVRKDGSYLSGAVGAFLGATLGAAAWAGVMLLGYISSLLGLLIGFLAERGYSLLRGKRGPVKIVILLISVVFGVLLGNFVSEMIPLIREMKAYGLSATFGEAVDLMVLILKEDAEARGGVIKNVLLGLFFAALGVFGLIAKTKQEVSTPKYIELN